MRGTRKLAAAAAVGALYAALTILLQFISFGTVQFRVAEALCVLPFYLPCSVWGLFLGCAVANILSAAGLPDVVFGSLATLLCSLCVSALGAAYRNGRDAGLWRRLSVCAMPMVFNAPIVGAVLAYAYTPGNFWGGMLLFGAQVAAGEAAVMLTLGLPLMRLLERNHEISELIRKTEQGRF